MAEACGGDHPPFKPVTTLSEALERLDPALGLRTALAPHLSKGTLESYTQFCITLGRFSKRHRRTMPALSPQGTFDLGVFLSKAMLATVALIKEAPHRESAGALAVAHSDMRDWMLDVFPLEISPRTRALFQ